MMKPFKINYSTLAGVIFVVGLSADLLPHPNLAPGLLVRTSTAISERLQPQTPEPKLAGQPQLASRQTE